MVRSVIPLIFKRTAGSGRRNTTVVLLILLIVVFTISLLSGRLAISVSQIVQMVSNYIQGIQSGGDLLSRELVFFWVRLPRCLMAVLVGASLAVSGAVYQGLFRNPLVSPDILGVSSGCTFGAALGLMLPIDSFAAVHVLSFGFGILAVFMSVAMARVIAVKPVIVLVLSGMVVLSFFNALLMAVKYFSDPYDELPGIIFWVMGSLTRVTWDNIIVMAPFALAGLTVFIVFGFRLNILSLGDLQAKSLGMNPAVFRAILITLSSFMVAIAVAGCGQIAWVGLVIPHMARNLAGPEHERMLPVTALLGALFLLLADTIARSVSAAEIPVGIVTALAGAPAFGIIMYKNRRTGWL